MAGGNECRFESPWLRVSLEPGHDPASVSHKDDRRGVSDRFQREVAGRHDVDIGHTERQFCCQYGRLQTVHSAITALEFVVVFADSAMIRDHATLHGQLFVVCYYGTSIAISA